MLSILACGPMGFSMLHRPPDAVNQVFSLPWQCDNMHSGVR